MKKLDSGYYYDLESHRIFREDADHPAAGAVTRKWKDRSAITRKSWALRVVLVLTGKCNLACSYCYAAQGAYGRDSVDRIRLEQIEATLAFLEGKFPEGVRQVQFFGGEPLLEPRAIATACEYIAASSVLKAAERTLVTNGTVMTDHILQLLKHHAILVTVSLDGDKEHHDQFRVYKRSGKGSYDHVAENIRRLTSAGVATAVQFTVSSGLVADYERGAVNAEAIAQQFEDLGVSYVHLSPVIGSQGGEFAFDELGRRVLLDFQRELLEELGQRGLNNSGRQRAISFLRTMQCNPAYCGAGLTEISIDMNGDIYPCFMFVNKKKFLLGSITTGITNEALLDVLEGNLKANNPACGRCAIRDFCNMCIGANHIENGDIRLPSRVMCDFQEGSYFASVDQLLIGRYVAHE